MFRRDSSQRRTDFAGHFAPVQLPGCVLWLRADMGLTLVPAVVASPNDISTGSWVGSNVANRTTSSFTDTTDGVPTTHSVIQNPISNLQLNHTAHFKIGIPAASGGGRFVYVLPNGGGDSISVDAQLGTIVNKTAPIANATYVNGVLDFDLVISNGALGFYTTPDGATISYTGSGSKSVTLGNNGLGVEVTVTQNQVSAWADQSGNGNNTSQGTATSQPLWTATGVNGQASLVFDGIDDVIASGAFVWNQPSTVLAVAQRSVAGAGLQNEAVDGLTTSTRLLLLDTTDKYDIFAGTLLSTGLVVGTSPHVLSALFNGASSTAALDGAATSGNAGAAAASGVTVGGRTAAFANMWHGNIAEVIGYNRLLSASERQTIERYLGTRYGILVA